MKLKIFFYLFFSQISISAQIDTTIWYPLKIGNYWEYSDNGLNASNVHESYTVIGDTIMPNGKSYSIIKIEDLLLNTLLGFSYRRLESNLYLYIWNRNTNREYKYYDFSIGDSLLWPIDSTYFQRKMVITKNIWNVLFQMVLERKEYENVFPQIIEREWQRVSKGVGEVLIGYAGGKIELIGAIINGKSYGGITLIDDKQYLPNNFVLNQNYPNPFNPSTNIKYSIAKTGQVSLKVYDSLGREVKILVEGVKNIGTYTVEFNGSDLSSGIYFIKLISGSFSSTIKAILLK